jgi:hypothetical protein
MIIVIILLLLAVDGPLLTHSLSRTYKDGNTEFFSFSSSLEELNTSSGSFDGWYVACNFLFQSWDGKGEMAGVANPFLQR